MPALFSRKSLASFTSARAVPALALLALGALSACTSNVEPATEATTSSSSGGGSSATGAGGSTDAGSTTSTSSGGTPVGGSITLSLESFDVQPGTERQVCKTVNLPSDVPFDIVRMRSTMSGTSHHFNAYKVTTDRATDPVTGPAGELQDCQPAQAQLDGKAAYIFGSASPERTLDLPAGVAFHLLPQQQIILEQHVINTTDHVITGDVSYELSAPAEGATIEHHADILWFANWSFLLPPSATTSDTTHCTVPYAIELFGLTSHTHSLGSHFSIEKWTPDGTTHVYDSDDWLHPPYEVYSPTLSLAAGEGLEWTCTWNNTTGKLVTPGKLSTDEMCMTFAYGYPKDSLGGDPVQCNE